jgi:hypothetical protein
MALPSWCMLKYLSSSTQGFFFLLLNQLTYENIAFVVPTADAGKSAVGY